MRVVLLKGAPSHLLSNPLEALRDSTATPAPSQTRTIGARTVFHEAQAALRPPLTSI
ncbi:hypothetical protein BDZ94DRAFT_1173922 [Collybia nuda]|uniref:Uncharacterized protein n=1 Tax=Collybia nuda TaxID=64659 RepID=A0A9P5XWX0_9AGAR|nr:hypothetical protein BDZ94DRAFT_1173922 [Collybia nuda]